MRTFGRLAAYVASVAILLFRSGAADAYEIRIVGTPYVHSTGNLTLTTTPMRISLSDFFNQYDETRWEIASVLDDASGGVQVTYRYPTYGTWDSYGAFANFGFEIVSETAGLAREPVEVDIWGSSYYHWEMFRACCFSDEPDVEIYGGGIGHRYGAPNNSYVTFSETSILQTNTLYNFDYFNVQYVEGNPQGLFPPYYFPSRAEYDLFVANNGTSGRVFTEAFGFMNFNLELRPKSVPEPSTLSMLCVGIAGVLVARRRRAAHKES